jgi:hypothetical protein
VDQPTRTRTRQHHAAGSDFMTKLVSKSLTRSDSALRFNNARAGRRALHECFALNTGTHDE